MTYGEWVVGLESGRWGVRKWAVGGWIVGGGELDSGGLIVGGSGLDSGGGGVESTS